MNRRHLYAAITLSLLTSSACSDGSRSSSHAVREVTVTMGEFYFETTDSIFEAGVPYRFVLSNVGQMSHEWAVVPRGDTDESRLLFEVEEDDLPAGASVTREFTFPEAGEYDFACYLAGHYESGMVLPVRVRAAEL